MSFSESGPDMPAVAASSEHIRGIRNSARRSGDFGRLGPFLAETSSTLVCVSLCVGVCVCVGGGGGGGQFPETALRRLAKCHVHLRGELLIQFFWNRPCL